MLHTSVHGGRKIRLLIRVRYTLRYLKAIDKTPEIKREQRVTNEHSWWERTTTLRCRPHKNGREAGAAPCFKNMTPCSLPAINIIMPLAMLPVNDVPRRATCQSYKFSLMLVSSLLCTMHFAYSSRNRDSSVPKLKESRVLRTSIKYSWREKSDFVTSSPQRESRTHLRCSALR